MAWSRSRADRGLSRPTSVFRTTIGVCKILSRSVEIWQYAGQKNLFLSKNRERTSIGLAVNNSMTLANESSTVGINYQYMLSKPRLSTVSNVDWTNVQVGTFKATASTARHHQSQSQSQDPTNKYISTVAQFNSLSLCVMTSLLELQGARGPAPLVLRRAHLDAMKKWGWRGAGLGPLV